MEQNEMHELSMTILRELHSRYDFVPFDRLDISVSQTETAGLLMRVFLLSQMLKRTGKSEHQKFEILDALDLLAKKGKIAITSMGIDKDMNYDDLGFRCIIGEGKRYFEHHIIAPQVRAVRLFSNMPLRKAEIVKLKSITEVKAEAMKVWKRRDDFFENRFRTRDLNFKPQKHELTVQTMRDNERK